MQNLIEFIQKHLDDDPSKLILSKDRWEGIDVATAADTISCYHRLRSKVPSWYACRSLVFPFKLAAEQCSSEATARYKAVLAARILSDVHTGGSGKKGRIADLTSGMGIDDWAFSQVAEEVLYNDMNPVLYEAARHNFKELGVDNVRFSNLMIGPSRKMEAYLGDFQADLIFADPARRDDAGKKVFLLEDCRPDILNLKAGIFDCCRHLLIKLSPMADIAMACGRLGRQCREVHIVGYAGECKELLIWMDREWEGDYSITVAGPDGKEAMSDGKKAVSDGKGAGFTFWPEEEKTAVATPVTADFINSFRDAVANGETEQSMLLFEPGKALMKSGAFNLISQRFGLKKLGISTHIYLFTEPSTDFTATSTDGTVRSTVGSFPEKVPELKELGKVFAVKEICEFNKKSLKQVGRRYPHSGVLAKNLPLSSEALSKKMGITSGDDAHIFALKSDCCGNLIFVTDRI